MITNLKNIWSNLRTWVKVGIVSSVGFGLITLYVPNKNISIRPTNTPELKEDTIKVKYLLPTITDVSNNKKAKNANNLFAFDDSDLIPEKAKKFIDRFINTAIVEKYKYGIPISITLAQGIIESNHGQSKLAVGHNNFFGLKCKEKCVGCDGKGTMVKDTCVNFHDDGADDYFRRFESAWESFRARSILLTSKGRYDRLFKLDPSDYVGWCYGLKACGYATHPKYAEILLNVIKKFELNKFDEIPIETLIKQRGIPNLIK